MAKIIASLFAESREQVVQSAQQAAIAGADWLELRLDRWPLQDDLGPLLGRLPLPVLVACRTPEDGGQFRGSLGERRELLSRALAGGAQGIDLEHWETWAPPSGLTGVKLRIRSFHSFTGVPRELAAIHGRLAGPGIVAKIAVTAHDLADAAPVAELWQVVDQQRAPTVAFAMGRTAWPTRVLAAAMGAPFVYASIAPELATAPGQPPIALLRGLYRVGELGAGTRWYGLLGQPASLSLGPWLHNRAFRRLRHDGVYLPLETSRPAEVVAMLAADRWHGLSVTSPHKERMLPVCQRLDEQAAALAAVNTLIRAADGSISGHNTDLLGVKAALESVGAGPGAGRNAVVLGAGGAARAAALALSAMGFRVALLARTLDPVREFARQHGIQLGSLSAAVVAGLAPAVVVHATPVGSADRDPEERLLPDYLPVPGTVLLDMVYRPPITRLLRDGAAAGARVVSGLWMFLAQAQAQLRLFTGAELDIAVLRGFLAGAEAGPAARSA